jgi:hypothetical protein
MKKKSKYLVFFLLIMILSSCKKKEVLQKEEIIDNIKISRKSLSYFCEANLENKFGIKIDNGSIICAKYPEIRPKIDSDKQLNMYYGFNNCCASIYFRTVNFNENATSDIIILRFGTIDEVIDFQNYTSNTPNGKLTIVNVNEKKLSGEFEAKITFNKKDYTIKGNFKDIQIDGL